jgi:hypothetical protein
MVINTWVVDLARIQEADFFSTALSKPALRAARSYPLSSKEE